MSLPAPVNSPASSVQPSIGHTSPPSTATPPYSVTVTPSPMAVTPPPETIASPVIAPVQPPPESSAPALSSPLPPPEGSPPPLPPLTPPESSSPPLPPPEKATSPIHEPSTPLPEIISTTPPPPANLPLPPMMSPAKPPTESNTAPASIPPPLTNPRHPDRPIQSPETSAPSLPPPSVVATPLKPNVTASPRKPPKFQTGSVPPASSIQPPVLHSGSLPPALSSGVNPQPKQGDFSPQGSNGSAPMSTGDEGFSVGRSSISKGVIIGGLIVGLLLFLVTGWLVSVYLKGRKGRKKGDKVCNGILLAGSKDQGDSDLPPNWKQNILPPASHIVPVLSSSLPSPPLRSREGDTSFSNSVQWPRALGVKFCIPSGWLTYDELVKITNNFSEANLIGQGGFGQVYKGILSNGKEVAVKQLKIDSEQGKREFQAEVDTISRVHHKHLVSLIGYSITGSDRLLVFEFVPNNTLEFHLHGKEQSVMEWSTRMKIAIGSAKGLAYLHEDCRPAIIHRDIKASNILLDFKFEAKVSDFGLAKSFPDDSTSISHISTRVMGTFGYLAPEYASSGQVTERSDVYSYGVMLLELLTGRPPISTTLSSQNQSLVGWAWPLLIRSLEDGIYDALVDPKLHGCYNSNEMGRMVACATACVQHSARHRPRMSQIIRALEGDTSLTDITESVRARYVFYGSSESSRYDVHEYNIERKKFERILASQEHAVTGYSQSTSEYGLHPSDSGSEYQNYQRETESIPSEIFKK